jgi:type I restriction enzyme S subunit
MKKGWQTKTVSEIAKHSLGKMLDKAKNKGEPKPYLRNLNVRWFDFDLSDVLEMRFMPEESAKYTAVKGDVLICEGGYPGRAAIWKQDEPIYFQKALHRVRFHEPERSKWFLYYLLSKDLDGTLKNHFNGAGIQHFTGEALAQFEVPLPPLPEQQRIVGILDEAFEGIATAKANAEKNLQNARAIFESHLQSVFSQRGEGWVEKRFVEVCVLQRGFDLPTRSRTSGDFPLVSSSGIIDTHNEGPVKGPGVATGRSGSIGNVFYIEEDYWPLNTVLYVKEFYDNNPKYVYRLLSHFDLKRFATGAGVPTLNRNFVHDERVVIPESSTTQREIAEQLDALDEKTQRLATLYERKLAALEALKKSLLHQAFTGEL